MDITQLLMVINYLQLNYCLRVWNYTAGVIADGFR
jgi:hypothetical protein